MGRPGGLVLALLAWAATAGGWEVRPAEYEWSVTVTAVVEVDGVLVSGANSLLAAFSGDECRGVAAPVYALGRSTFFLTVYADTVGETIRFLVDLDGTGAVVELAPRITVQANAAYGNPLDPLLLEGTGERSRPPSVTAVAGDTSWVAAPPELDPPFPNPFHSRTQVSYAVARAGWVEVEVRNVLGQRVRVLIDRVQAPGRWQVQWDGRDDSGRRLPSGVYLCCVRVARALAAHPVILNR